MSTAMSIPIRVVVGVAKFLYGYLVGDDLLVALVMVLGLLATAGLVAHSVAAWWLLPVLAVAMTGVNLRRGANSPTSS